VRVRLLQQALLHRQVDHDRGRDQVGQQERLIRQVRDRDLGAAPLSDQVQVGPERPLHRGHGDRGLVVIADVVGQQLHVSGEIRLGVAEAEQPEALPADGDQVVAAVVVALRALQDRGAAGVVERGHAVDAGLAAVPDGDHPELPRLGPVQQVGD
jgi:hypothetical protein